MSAAPTPQGHTRTGHATACMPDELRALAVTEAWLGRTESAVRRVLDHGLPSSALYDWIMDCAITRHERLRHPARRDTHLPPEAWDIVAMIPARGGSRGVPRKALRTVNGVPLVARAVAACRAVPGISRVMINTDCPDIAAAAKAAGADAPFLRPAELATDTASPHDAWVFAQVWMLLVERRVPDFLITASATHPCLHPGEMLRGLHRLAAANRPSLQTVARLPAASLDFLTLDHERGAPLQSGPGPSPEPDGKDDGPYLQCGAFSINGNRPYYHVQPWFRPHMTDVPATPDAPLAHVLSAPQGVDIDEPWDLAACRLLLAEDDPFPPCTPQDVAAHRPAGAGDHARQQYGNLACVVMLPPDNAHGPDGPDRSDRPAPASPPQGQDGPYLRLAGSPAPCRVLDAVRSSLPGVPLALCGQGVMARAVADRYGLPLLPPPAFLAANDAHATANPEWPVPLLPRAVLAAGTAPWTAHPELADPLRGNDILCIDGRAALLDAATLRQFAASARRMAAESAPASQDAEHADGHPLPVCSVSPAPVHPAHLKTVDAAGSVISAPGTPARRQDLPHVWCRDGVLTLLRATPASAPALPPPGCPGRPPFPEQPDLPERPGISERSGISGQPPLPYLPVPVGRAQSTVVATRLDAARATALAAHDAPSTSNAAPATTSQDAA